MSQPSQESGVRLDKWLWAARFYKTRAIARTMIEGSKVHYNGVRGKPSKIVEEGAEIRLRQGNDERTVTILMVSSQRQGATQAQGLYCETPESIAKREKIALARKMNALTMPHPERRPDKKERRTLLRFKQTNLQESD
ncbi:ribosome-associated heat shock protein Hsp15 [Proteus alimentorum]|uniref:Heat shock protein 15 n=1 Tax=Proteus alimentorum TaxID=1973495 RepID=A0ABS0IXL8_9GAMM|nr:ribosome-associated heat shock protein Hsp15 [Proteus alimentorum]MBG2876946.1 ribosome-associated heat shock protein Hsp15 [Proteus alimentorum]MBG2880426.1 ribosome-associated heat shock protein Hsp15 [Proteus alimentorum]